jgi:hypothetical protein
MMLFAASQAVKITLNVTSNLPRAAVNVWLLAEQRSISRCHAKALGLAWE